MKIGVLALQGAFAEHIAVLSRLGIEGVPVRLPGELEGIDGLIIPGGESTTISRLMQLYHLVEPLKSLAQQGLPILGTCAGLIILANKVSEFKLESVAAMDIEVRRNAFGRQVDSFETMVDMPVLGNEPFPAVFIRAPHIEKAGAQVNILARLNGDIIVAAQQGKLLVSAFHPELTTDLRFHAYFLKVVGAH